MEMGNLVFGNSRGNFPIPNRQLWEKTFISLINALHMDYYVKEFENDVFSLFPYYWGECTCGCNISEDEEHKEDCLLVKPNFLYKLTGYAIEWYKYFFRDSYSNQNITIEEFEDIVEKCIESIKK